MASILKTVLKLIALTIILLVISGIGAKFIPVDGGGGEAAGGAVPPIALILVVFFFQSLALALPVLWSRWHGLRLSAAIFVVYFGTVTFLSQIESLVYLGDKMPGSLTSGLFAMGVFVAAVFSPICVLVL